MPQRWIAGLGLCTALLAAHLRGVPLHIELVSEILLTAAGKLHRVVVEPS